MYTTHEKIESVDRNPFRLDSFDSVAEFSKPKDNPRSEKIWRESVLEKFKEKSDSYNKSWFGCATYDQFIRILSHGDIRYVNMIEKALVDLPLPRSLKRRRMWGEFGEELCIHKVNSGNLSTAWNYRSPKTRTGAKNIRLVVTIGNNSSSEAEELQWIGVAALAVAQSAINSGYSVAIDAIAAGTNTTGQENLAQLMPIKTYGEPLDVMSLSSVVCFPGFFRGPGFMNHGLCENGTINSSLGRAVTDINHLGKILTAFGRNTGEMTIIIPNSVDNQTACENVINQVMDTLLPKDQRIAMAA